MNAKLKTKSRNNAAKSQASAGLEKSGLVTDLGQYCLSRRYQEEDIAGVGRMRFQSLNTREFGAIAKHSGMDQMITAIIYCLVDENNDRVYVDDDETRAKLQSMDAAVLAQISGVLNHFALGEVDEAAAKKN